MWSRHLNYGRVPAKKNGEFSADELRAMPVTSNTDPG
jgi:hypothetical protein